VDRPPFEQPHDRDERRVEDRHGEDQDRQSSVATVEPATL
jgi:hypothetical protein